MSDQIAAAATTTTGRRRRRRKRRGRMVGNNQHGRPESRLRYHRELAITAREFARLTIFLFQSISWRGVKSTRLVTWWSGLDRTVRRRRPWVASGWARRRVEVMVRTNVAVKGLWLLIIIILLSFLRRFQNCMHALWNFCRVSNYFLFIYVQLKMNFRKLVSFFSKRI